MWVRFVSVRERCSYEINRQEFGLGCPVFGLGMFCGRRLNNFNVRSHTLGYVRSVRCFGGFFRSYFWMVVDVNREFRGFCENLTTFITGRPGVCRDTVRVSQMKEYVSPLGILVVTHLTDVPLLPSFVE